MKNTITAIPRPKLKSFQYEVRFVMENKTEGWSISHYYLPAVDISECKKRLELKVTLPDSEERVLMATTSRHLGVERLWEEGVRWTQDSSKPVLPVDE
jgi:hypothetical protein